MGFRFGGFRLDPDGTLRLDGTPVPLPAPELAGLRLLLERQGQVVTRLELKQAIWGDEPAPADSVSKCLTSLRKRLEPAKCIQTVYRRGYRFCMKARPFGGAPSAPLPRLAILPFANSFGIPEYLGPAVAQEVGDRLAAAQPAAVSVLARESVFALARRGLAPRRIGETLQADLVLTGSLHLVSSCYRLHAEMIRVEDGGPIWLEDRLVDRSQLAGLEAELVNLVTFRISGSPAGEAESAARIARGDWSIAAAAEAAEEQLPQRREAYELFVRARYEWQSLERHRMQDALQSLLQVAALDPGLIAARVSLAHLCVAQAYYGFLPPAVAADFVHRAAEPVSDLPARAEAILPALGWVNLHFDRNLPAALWWLARSGHLPHDPWITRARTLVALSRHRFGEAADLLQAAIRVDPWSAWLQARLAWTHHLGGNAALSVELARRALERFPEHEGTRFFGAIIFAWNGEAGQAVDLAHGLAQRLPYLDPAAAVHAYALAMAGRGREARAILDRLEWLGRERYVMNTFAPAVYAALGEHEAALAGLRAAADSRCPWFFQMLADPRLKLLAERPEFQSMLGILTGMEADAERDPMEE